MRPKRDLNYNDLSGQVVFWTGGNRPTQNALNLDEREVDVSLKSCFLLSDVVVAAASYFFESSITRRVTRNLSPLFGTGRVLYFVDEAIESFEEHGARKMEKSPISLTAYRSAKMVARHATEMNRLGFILRRPPASISDILVERWIGDLFSSDSHSIGTAVSTLPVAPDRRAAIRMRLIEVAQRRTTDFVWEVVAPVLLTLRTPTYFQRLVRQRLAGMYSETTAELIGATVDSSDHRLTKDVSGPMDTVLFHRLLESLDADKAFSCLTASDCIAVKRSAEWSFFYSFYSKLLAEIGSIEVTDLGVLPLLKDAERIWKSPTTRPRGVSRQEFVASLERVCKPLTRNAKRFSRPADFLLAICESFSRAPIADFIQLLMDKANRKAVLMPRRRLQKAVGIITIKPVELQAVKELLGRRGRIIEREGKQVRRRFFEGSLSGYKHRSLPSVCLRALDQGNPSVQSACHALLTEYDIHLLILLGVAGGISQKLDLCDVVVADAVYNYERRAITDHGTAHRLDAYKLSASMSELYGRFMEDHGEEPELDAAQGSKRPQFRTYKAPIGSGEAVVKSKLAEVRTWLHSVNENVAAVETEAVGASHVAHELELTKGPKPIGLLIVRGISDHADYKKEDRWQRPAADNACVVLDNVLKANRPLNYWSKNLDAQRID